MSEYKEQIDKMLWSYSRISSYSQCPYNFFLKYIVNDNDQYLSEGNYYAEVGSFVHKILEKIFIGELSLDEAPKYYLNHFDENVFYQTKQSIMDKTYESCANFFSELELPWLNDCELLGVEKSIEVSIDGYKFCGFIDLLLRKKNTNEIYLIDHKSSAYPFKADGKTVLKKQENSFENYKHQMYLYCKAVFDEYGEFPKWIIWNHFKDQKIAKIPFKKSDYEKALKWLVNQIHSIEEDDCFEPHQDFFYCTNLCEFRASCEYANDRE